MANWIPFEDPAGGPNFYRFDDRARYYINIDNTGDGKSTTSATGSSSRPRSGTRTRSCTRCPACSSINDPKLNVQQTYTLTRQTYKQGQGRSRRRCVARDLPVAPNNVGPKTIPELQRGRQPGDPRRCRAAARCSPASVTTRSSSTSARRSTRSTSATGTGNRAAARTTSPATACTRSCCRCPRQQVTKDGKAVARPRRQERRRRRLGLDRAPARSGLHGRANGDDDGERRRLRPGLAAWATRWSTRSSSRSGKKDKFNRTQPAATPSSTASTSSTPELAQRHERAVRPRRHGDGPDGHRPGAAQGIPGLNQMAEPASRPTRSSSTSACRPRPTRTASACSAATTRASRTAAA